MPINEPEKHIYIFGDFRVDAIDRQLFKGNDLSLPLTPKVFDTLLYLVRHSGKVVGKDELMREIWADTVVEENNLSQNISILRRILGEKPGEGRFIATVAGRGFRFVPEVREIRGEQQEPADQDAVELTAGIDGEKSVQPPKPNTAAPGTGRLRIAAFALLAVVIAAGSLAFYLSRTSVNSQALGPLRTIAILPFKPLVADDRDEALEIGMADTLIARLGTDRGIVVRPLSSVRKFGSLEQDAAAAGRELGVAAVLDGSIQRSGDDIRVNAQLVKVDDGTLLWTGTFDEKFSGIFTVQDAIAQRVAAALAVELGRTDARFAKRQTSNVEAYQLYLRGRFQVFKLTPADVNKGISYFQQAIAIDPNYAYAYAGIADAYRALALGSEMPPTESLSRSKAAAQKAVELDDDLSEAHAALAMTMFWGEWNWAEAEAQFKRAIELDPNSANGHLFYAHLLSNLARHDEALAEIKIARALDPLFPFAGAIEGQILSYAGRNDEALEKLRETADLAPRFWMPHLFAAGAYTKKGQYEEAVAEARTTGKLEPSQTASVAYECYALAKLGKNDDAQAGLNELLKLSKERFVPPYHIAIVYNGLGRSNEALDWLERGFTERDPKMTFLKVDTRMNNLRDEPRFISLMQRMGL